MAIGRPRKKVDLELLEKLAAMHCTNKEIAHALDISIDTLTDRFSHILEKGRCHGKRSLRKLQWDAAIKGSHVMLVWLGKQYLGQKDKSDEEIEAIKQSGLQALSKEDLIDLIRVARDEKAKAKKEG